MTKEGRVCRVAFHEIAYVVSGEPLLDCSKFELSWTRGKHSGRVKCGMVKRGTSPIPLQSTVSYEFSAYLDGNVYHPRRMETALIAFRAGANAGTVVRFDIQTMDYFMSKPGATPVSETVSKNGIKLTWSIRFDDVGGGCGGGIAAGFAHPEQPALAANQESSLREQLRSICKGLAEDGGRLRELSQTLDEAVLDDGRRGALAAWRRQCQERRAALRMEQEAFGRCMGEYQHVFTALENGGARPEEFSLTVARATNGVTRSGSVVTGLVDRDRPFPHHPQEAGDGGELGCSRWETGVGEGGRRAGPLRSIAGEVGR
jgi:hypothetical protein